MARSQKRKNQDNNAQMSRRALVLGGLMSTTCLVLAGRMRYLQLERADDFRLLAEENRINLRLLPPARGVIYDRHGTVLADNSPNYRITMVREYAGDVDLVLSRLSRIVNIDRAKLDRARDEMMSRPPFVPVTIADRLSWEEFSLVSVNAPALPGITPDVGLSRDYPLGADFSHVVGYVGPVSDYYLETTGDTDPVLQIPDFQVGRYNVEARLEDVLRGRAGSKRVEVNAAGRVMRELDRSEAQPGADVQLTVDAYLQNYAEARLEGESAGAVVIDTQNGDILALASAPTYDPNLFVRGIPSSIWETLNTDPYRPLANKATQGLYPPGSTYKMVVALAALEAGLIDPSDTVFCGGSLQLGNRRFHCWKRGGHGHMDMVQSIAQSCDVYYYDLAQRVGIDAISAMAERLGCGVRHDVPLSGVATGIAPTMDWKLSNRGEPWVMGDTLNASIGQGFVLNSPLQLAVMTARLASGLNLNPRLIRSVDGVEPDYPAITPLDVNPANLEKIRDGMFEVSNGARGTALGSRTVLQDYLIAGKTGTSQVRNITAAERAAGVIRNEDLPWERRDHALFVGYAPAHAPRYAIALIVEHGGGGSAAAAPLARDILLYAMFDDLPPLDAYPANQRAAVQERHAAMTLLPRRGSPDAPTSGTTGTSRA